MVRRKKLAKGGFVPVNDPPSDIRFFAEPEDAREAHVAIGPRAMVKVRSAGGPDATYEIPRSLLRAHPERYEVVDDD
jgi:hypothetical protein